MLVAAGAVAAVLAAVRASLPRPAESADVMAALEREEAAPVGTETDLAEEPVVLHPQSARRAPATAAAPATGAEHSLTGHVFSTLDSQRGFEVTLAPHDWRVSRGPLGANGQPLVPPESPPDALRTTTDARGRFAFDDVKSGRYLLRIVAPRRGAEEPGIAERRLLVTRDLDLGPIAVGERAQAELVRLYTGGDRGVASHLARVDVRVSVGDRPLPGLMLRASQGDSDLHLGAPPTDEFGWTSFDLPALAEPVALVVEDRGGVEVGRERPQSFATGRRSEVRIELHTGSLAVDLGPYGELGPERRLQIVVDSPLVPGETDYGRVLSEGGDAASDAPDVVFDAVPMGRCTVRLLRVEKFPNLGWRTVATLGSSSVDVVAGEQVRVRL